MLDHNVIICNLISGETTALVDEAVRQSKHDVHVCHNNGHMVTIRLCMALATGRESAGENGRESGRESGYNESLHN